ncbi:Uncharacterised protein [Mycobacteroides abscessus subsp. abscessus]|nr:Uncharacterised protein [Mycobacteroides abscessus subsp. abscessus]
MPGSSTSAGVGAISVLGARMRAGATGVGAPSGSITVITASPVPRPWNSSARS